MTTGYIEWQNGFKIKTRVNCSLRVLLCEHFRIPAEYLEDQIKTIFIDGHPVDDPDSVIVRDGSTIALSGAMPGLVGAAMRRGGVLSSFRDTITHRSDSGDGLQETDGVVYIKLFNMLLKELMPHFLKMENRIVSVS